MNSQIVDAIKNDKLVFFIGAGFSKPLGYPSWNDLVEKFLVEISKDYKELVPFLQIIRDDNQLMSTIDILEYLLKHKERVYKIMDEEFSEIELKSELLPESLVRHKLVTKISSKIITTNYDKSLEKANPNLKCFTYNNDYKIANMNSMSNYVFKLHGCINDAAQCILFKENYENLYSQESEYKNAIEEIKKVISDKTIIFLGFSLTDPYVKYQFDYINKIYKNLSGKHFIITTEDKTDIEGLEVLKINNWDDGLDDVLNELLKIKESIKQDITIKIPHKEVSASNTTNIAIMYAEPIDEHIEFPLNKVIKPFKGMDVKIDIYSLSIKNLNKLDNYSYIFIFTKFFKNSLVIEDEYLMARKLKVEELKNEIIDESLFNIFIFTENFEEIDAKNIQLPIINKRFDKDYETFIFKVLRKNLDFQQLSYNTQYINCEDIARKQIEKGERKVEIFKTPLPPEIDPKQLLNFVGRKTDLENISRKIIDLNGKILTIKGSGGIGKTTILKKVVVELSQRELFQDGIYFVDCQIITDLDTFKRKISQCFNILNTFNLIEDIKNLDESFDKLIIIDNFESLLQLDVWDKIEEMVTFICDYANVVCTSREWLNFEFEDKYELRYLTTDECVELFQQNYGYKIDDNERKILRVDIIENLLNNNPLAIKIVTSNIPKLKSMFDLKKDLEEDFFNTTKLGYEDIFDSAEDLNIEKSKSLYQSINYSYCKLLAKEKLVFELLSLFPDGIKIENFITFVKNSKQSRNGMSGKELKSLEDKSLIQIANSSVSLQSIISRFALHKFNERKLNEKIEYFNQALDYNMFILSSIDEYATDNKTRLMLYDRNINNFYQSLTYLEQVTLINKEDMFNYLVKISYAVAELHSDEKFVNQFYRLKSFFSEIEQAELAIDLLIIKMEYYMGLFDESLKKLLSKISLDEVLNLLDNGNFVTEVIVNSALSVYPYGREYEILSRINKNIEGIAPLLKNLYFTVGDYKKFKELANELALKKIKRNLFSFFDLEASNNLGQLSVNEIDSYLTKLIYNKEHLEILQVNYIKAKMGYLNNYDEIRKLLVVNPYTQGLKELMFAFLENDIIRAEEYYIKSVLNLKHIPYYCTEAMYYYAKFLKEQNSEKYNEILQKGLEQAIDYKYEFLIHKFNCLINDVEIPYVEEERELFTSLK